MNKWYSLDLRDWYWEEEKNNKAKAKQNNVSNYLQALILEMNFGDTSPYVKTMAI